MHSVPFGPSGQSSYVCKVHGFGKNHVTTKMFLNEFDCAIAISLCTYTGVTIGRFVVTQVSNAQPQGLCSL